MSGIQNNNTFKKNLDRYITREPDGFYDDWDEEEEDEDDETT